MKFAALLLTAFLPIALPAQKSSTIAHPVKEDNPYSNVDQRVLQLPDSIAHSVEGIGNFINAHFQTPTEKTRAIFIWIAHNIQYDVANMFAINFYEDESSKVTKPLQTRKGICENYAALFAAICRQAGIRSVIIEGYTKQQGFVDFIPHAWNAAFLDGGWYLFDATWGSGFVSGGKFVQHLNNAYFKAAPESFIKSHMPFDYLWEFLAYPISNQDFYEGKTGLDKSKPYFNYTDSIEAYLAMNHIDQEKSEAVRVEKNGTRNSLIFDRLQHLKIDIENYDRQAEVDRKNAVVSTYNGSIRDFNIGIRLLNTFINYRNSQFKPAKTDAEIQQMLDTADHQIQQAKLQIDTIHLADADPQLASMLPPFKQSLEEATAKLREQKEWLTKYFSKSKLARKSMFYQVTLFGKPVN
jgi:hypothetical protein